MYIYAGAYLNCQFDKISTHTLGFVLYDNILRHGNIKYLRLRGRVASPQGQHEKQPSLHPCLFTHSDNGNANESYLDL